MTEVRYHQVFKYILKNVAVVSFQNHPLYLLRIVDTVDNYGRWLSL